MHSPGGCRGHQEICLGWASVGSGALAYAVLRLDAFGCGRLGNSYYL